jgi:hypothetical protein
MDGRPLSPVRAIGRSSGGPETLVPNPSRFVGMDVSALQPRRQEPTEPSPMVKALSTMSRTSTRSIPLRSLPTPNARTQTADAEPPAFEAASVTPNPSGRLGFHRGPVLSGGELTAVNVQLQWLIVEAYGMNDYQMLGAPSWISEDYCDVSAKAHGVSSTSS